MKKTQPTSQSLLSPLISPDGLIHLDPKDTPLHRLVRRYVQSLLEQIESKQASGRVRKSE